jgi:MFS family permease
MPWNPSDPQLMASVLCPKFTAIASVVGSSLIIRDVIQIRKNRSDDLSTRHRILAGMSVCDILSSSAWFLTSWPVPEDFASTVWNVGNKQTCSAQGFFIQLGIGTVIYNACLALYYLLVIRYGRKNEYITKRVEPWMHIVAVGFALSTGVASLSLDIFNPIGYSCTITAYPRFCTQSYENKGPTNCIRGDNARIYLVAFWLGPACCVIVWLAVSMFLVYWKIRTTERSSSHLQSHPGRLRHRFALQAFLYVGAMFITWGPMLGVYIHRKITSTQPNWWVSRSVLGRCESFLTKETVRDEDTMSCAASSRRFDISP